MGYAGIIPDSLLDMFTASSEHAPQSGSYGSLRHTAPFYSMCSAVKCKQNSQQFAERK